MRFVYWLAAVGYRTPTVPSSFSMRPLQAGVMFMTGDARVYVVRACAQLWQVLHGIFVVTILLPR